MENKTLQAFEEAINSSKECGPHTGHSVMVITPNAAKACYDIYKAECIKFAEWIINEEYDQLKSGKWTQFLNKGIGEYLTSDQLFDLFQQSKDK